MKGYVEIKPNPRVITKIEKAVNAVDDFLHMMKSVSIGHYETRKTWFGLSSRKVWVIEEPKNMPKGAFIYSHALQKVKPHLNDFSDGVELMELVSDYELDHYNYMAGTNQYYSDLCSILELYKANSSMITLGEKLAEVYNNV